MAQSTEPTDTPIDSMEAATELLAKGTAMIQWQREELERRAKRIAQLEHTVRQMRVMHRTMSEPLAVMEAS